MYAQTGRHRVTGGAGELGVLGRGSVVYRELGRVQGRCSLAGRTSWECWAAAVSLLITLRQQGPKYAEKSIRDIVTC